VTDPKTQKVIKDSSKLTSAKKSLSRISGFTKILKEFKSKHKSFKSKIRSKLNSLESVFLEIDKEVQFYKKEILKHNSILKPCKHLLEEAQVEKNFLQRYRYSAGANPEIMAVMEMLDQRIKTLKEIMPMEVPLKEIIDEIKYKWHDQVIPKIKALAVELFADMNMLNRVTDFMKNYIDEIDLQKMVRPVLNPFIDFYGKRVVEEWGTGVTELDHFKDKIYMPFDTYTVVYFSVRESIVETVVNSVKPFMNNLKRGA
jgi:DNA repair exonuclease SbcCD ATPase subunit